MKMAEPDKAIFKDPADPTVWHWTYTLPGPDGVPLYVDGGYASNPSEAAVALNAARAEGSLKWQAHIRALSSPVPREGTAGTRRVG